MPALTKLTINLRTKTDTALDFVCEMNDETRTEAVNRAIILYESISREIREGGSIIIKSANGKEETLKLL
jgi:hypothetical protein